MSREFRGLWPLAIAAGPSKDATCAGFGRPRVERLYWRQSGRADFLYSLLAAPGKPPLRPCHVWSIRTKLQIKGKKRDLALFNLAIDSKLRRRDVVAVRVDDGAPSG